jgi:adenosylmethionine---8-amino-7-oxononanoate aminotransferase
LRCKFLAMTEREIMGYKDSKIWHPFTQHGLNEPIIKIKSAKDEFLYTDDGKKIIDGISSWWVNTLGHSNPAITKAICEQAQNLQQVIFAGFTHNPAEEVAAKIRQFLPPKLEYAFFSDSGSTSVEVALKMAVGYFHNKGFENKTKIVAFEKAYHGDTFGGMSSGAKSVFNKAYNNMLFDVIHLPFPEKGVEDKTINTFEEILRKQSDEIAAIIVEPLILGSGGMLIYEPFVIDELYKLAKENNVFFILDEVMTGFGRTGSMFAFEQTSIVPDIICLSKGLTGGNLPLALTVATKEIYDAFYSKRKADMFFHSSSYTANPIACAAACANLDIWAQEPILKKVKNINKSHLENSKKFEQNKFVKNVRVLGSIFALDINVKNDGYLSDIATDLYSFYLKNGVLLRPLGNTVYIMPPYCISQTSLNQIYDTIEKSISWVNR